MIKFLINQNVHLITTINLPLKLDKCINDFLLSLLNSIFSQAKLLSLYLLYVNSVGSLLFFNTYRTYNWIYIRTWIIR